MYILWPRQRQRNFLWAFECTHFLGKSSVKNKRALFSRIWELSVTFPTSSSPLTTSPDAERMWSFFLLTNIVLFHRVDNSWMCYFRVLANTDIMITVEAMDTLFFQRTAQSPLHAINGSHACFILLFSFLRGLHLPVPKAMSTYCAF